MDTSEPKRKEINLVMTLENGTAVHERFMAVEVDAESKSDGNKGWQIRNVPGLIENISFGDIFVEKTEGKRGWKLVKKSPYSTVVVVVKEHMRNDHGLYLVKEMLQPVVEIPNVIYENERYVHRFAVRSPEAEEVAKVLDEGQSRRFWEWAATSDRVNIAYLV